MKRILTALWLVLAVPALAFAQTYPDPETITVNDFAGLLPPEAEAEIGADLDSLRADTGIEFTVVTLSRKEPFAPDQDLETFAAGLFDQWGIGDADRNDGILLLVLHGDREVRLELGKGYNNEWNRQARDVIDRAVLPAFREDRYEAGIRAGVTRTIETIARPFHAGAAPPESSGGISGWWASLLFAPFVLMILWRSLKDRITAMGRCPQCGQRMLSVTRETIMAATRNSAGRGRRVIRCQNCDYAQENEYSISRLGSSKSSSSGFSGGSSGGGGASGRW
ncbi:TPM domain-containing protein [Marimonas lutisalis]|uniref:TPM domain-containing protein n=1 Tax=Marimonas lutisalis TaxID=2545756 RepID=UPI0010FA4382|nr:TPM domain-containing protein [Marimonas lutisalis]